MRVAPEAELKLVSRKIGSQIYSLACFCLSVREVVKLVLILKFETSLVKCTFFRDARAPLSNREPRGLNGRCISDAHCSLCVAYDLIYSDFSRLNRIQYSSGLAFS